MSLSAVVFVPPLLMVIFAKVLESDDFTYFSTTLYSFFRASCSQPGLASLMVGIVGREAIIRATAVIYVGQAPSILGCLQNGVEKFCRVLGVTALIMLFFLMVFLPMVFWYILLILGASKKLVIPLVLLFMVGLLMVNFYTTPALSMVIPALVVEGVGPIRSLQRAWELANGRRCYIFCSLFLFGFLQTVVSQIFITILTAGGPRDTIYGAVVSAVPISFFYPLMIIMTTVLYISVRVDKEGLNAEVLQRNLGGVVALGQHEYSTLPAGLAEDVETRVIDHVDKEGLNTEVLQGNRGCVHEYATLVHGGLKEEARVIEEVEPV